MPKKYFRRIMPKPDVIRDHPSLQHMQHWLGEPNLWHLNRHSVARGCAAGVFSAFLIPIGQMPLAALISIFIRGNLPLSAAFTWVTNPFTYAPLYYFCYKVGEWVLGVDASSYQLEWTLEAILNDLSVLTGPFFVGASIVAVITSALTYWVIQAIWRLNIAIRWSKRKHRHTQHKDL